MRALVVYESMYGNTRHVAEAIAEGLGGEGVATLVPIAEASDLELDDCERVSDCLCKGWRSTLRGTDTDVYDRGQERVAAVSGRCD